MLSLSHIVKKFDQNTVLKGVSLTVEQGEIICLLGASGCGKSTLLRIIAGLERADAGQLTLDGQNITAIPVHERDFGLMFQDFALFPHLNVAQNIAFGLQMQQLARGEIQKRIGEVLALVGLAGFERRSVNELSGGEQQRVALARSLAPQPRLLMLDEPLGSLDAALRERLVLDLRQIIKAAGLTAIYVTHDQQEAFAIADRVAVMNAGQIEQVAAPEMLYLHPETVFVAEFLGLKNVISAENIAALGVNSPPPESAERVLLHPAYAEVVPPETQDAIPLVLENRVFRGIYTQLNLRHASGIDLTLYLPASVQLPAVGDEIHVRFRQEGIIPLK